jgi:L-ascorbate metabolism protein UlaG (beta-lactamase superfamily)
MIVPLQKDEVFVEDFHNADKVTGAIHVWWLGQSGFLIKWNGHGMLIDPYLSDSITRAHHGTDTPYNRVSERVVDPLQLSGVDLVVCTSLRPDRFDPETILPLRAANPALKLIVPAGRKPEALEALGAAAPPVASVNAGTYTTVNPFDFHGIDAATPKIRRDEYGNSKEIGYVIVFGPFTIYVSGETIWHSQLIKQVRRWPINLAILPINGDQKTGQPGDSLNGFEAAALAKAISANIVMPAHFDLFDTGNVSTEEFVISTERLGQRQRILQLGQRMTMGPVTDPASGKAPPSEPQPQSNEWGLGY